MTYMHDLISQGQQRIRDVGLVEFAREAEAVAHALNASGPTTAARRVASDVAKLLRLFRAMAGEWKPADDADAERVTDAIAGWCAGQECPIPPDEAFATAPVEQSTVDSDYFRARLDGHAWWVLREEDADFDGDGYVSSPSFVVQRREAEQCAEPWPIPSEEVAK
jgi:hypothetical protein